MQKQSLTCKSPIEKGYYNCDRRALKLKDLCYYCGEKGNVDFLCSLQQLCERNMTGRYNCYPICIECIGKKKKIIKGNKKNAIHVCKEHKALDALAASGN